jgi:predicted glycosyltransferase
MIILEETDLTPSLLSKKIKEHLKSPSMSADIKLDGAKETAGQIEKWSEMARGARNP